MEPTVLIYGVEGAQAKRLRGLFARKNVRARFVRPEEYGEPVGAMCGARAKTGAAPDGGELRAMLVFCRCTTRQLDMLISEIRTARLCPDALRAVLTEHNAAWSGERLCAELINERKSLESDR